MPNSKPQHDFSSAYEIAAPPKPEDLTNGLLHQGKR